MPGLQIKYDAAVSEVDYEFDQKITKFVEDELGYEWRAEGYDFKTKVRDLNFEKK